MFIRTLTLKSLTLQFCLAQHIVLGTETSEYTEKLLAKAPVLKKYGYFGILDSE